MSIAFGEATAYAVGAADSNPIYLTFVSAPADGDSVFVLGSLADGGSTGYTPAISDNQTGNTYSLRIVRSTHGDTSFPTTNISEAYATIHECLSVNYDSGSFQITVGGTITTNYCAAIAIRCSGVSAYDVSTANDSKASQSSMSSGTTGTTALADSIAISSLAVWPAVDEHTPYTNSGGYTILYSHFYGGAAYKILTATGTQSCVYDYSVAMATNDGQAAVIAVYSGIANSQTAGPGSTVAAGSWTASTTTLHGDVDETTADNADYDYSSTNSDTLKLGTYGLVDPGVDTGFTIDYRVSATSTDQLTLYLYEGTTLRATDTTRTPGATPTDYSWAVPSASVANISDWSAIQTWLTTGTHGGATDTGAKFPTTTSTASETGYADNDWTTIANITADDTSYATITHPTYDTGKHSYVAYAKGFDFSAIPDSSTITGVECIYCGWYDAGTAEGILAQLCDTAGARVGTNKWATPVALSGTTGATVTIGGTGDTWGNSLTAAWVKDPDFGVAFSINATSNNTDISCDYVTLKVFYTPPAADWRLQWIRITAPGVDSQLIPFARIALQAVQRASTW